MKNDIITCKNCGKEIHPDSENAETYETRIDRKLPGETSHFKHIHVTYYFCNKKCKDEYLNSPEPSSLDGSP